jgi:hypothetical protein
MCWQQWFSSGEEMFNLILNLKQQRTEFSLEARRTWRLFKAAMISIFALSSRGSGINVLSACRATGC